MLDLSKVHNPYDFSNPVSDQELFIGRKDELRDIRYYLDHAKTAPRPINIALLGPRASGKTSLLNMCEIEAKKRDFCTVRINLDEGDVKTQLSYFYKVFDGIFSAVCELGLYGGIVGKTYETYIEMTNAYEVPEDKTFCPCLFPIQYAKAMSSRNVEASISDFNFMRDLIKIRDELKKPIALLFDECNVLATSRVLLEKIRNIFMNTSGYMLVFTGTADLFPVMDEIFSPIIRQFKKINVSGFEDKQDTEDCIRKPLEKIGLKAEAIFEREALRDIEVVHDLSGGKPYEIQLICHFMFRRVQEKRANKMKIDLSLLEEVRRELETSQDITERPIITKIRNLSRKKLSALRLLCSCDDCASFDQIWIIEYIFNGEKKWTRDQLYEEFIYFIDEGIIKNDDDKISFSGDDFDRIYVKYFAREQKIILEFREYDLKELIFARMRGYVRSSGDIRSISLYSSEFEDKIPNMINELALPSSDVDVFVENPILAGDFYEILFQYRDEVSIPYIRIEITFPWVDMKSWYYCPNPKNIGQLDIAIDNMSILSNRILNIGGEMNIEKKTIQNVPLDILINKTKDTANESFREEFAFFHLHNMYFNYMQEKKPEEAAFHAKIVIEYDQNHNHNDINNMGYVFMAANDLEQARSLLQKVAVNANDESILALSNYNIAILEAKCGNFEKSLEKVELCIKFCGSLEKKERKMGRLFLPKISTNKIEYEELMEPDLLESAEKLKSIIESFIKIRSEL